MRWFTNMKTSAYYEADSFIAYNGRYIYLIDFVMHYYTNPNFLDRNDEVL